MRQEATSQNDLINMGPRQQRPRGKRCTGAEGFEGISVQGAVTCSVGRLFQQRRPDSPKLAVPTSSATDILKFSGRGTGASIWGAVLALCASMDQDYRAAHQSTAKPQTAKLPAESPFQLCSTIQLLDLLLSTQAPSDPPQHIYHLQNLGSNTVQYYPWPLRPLHATALPLS